MNRRFGGAFRIGAVVAALAVAALLITPAGAHVTGSVRHLWRQHIKPKLSTPGSLNNPVNPVDWTRLKGVPGDFADGIDDTGGGGGGGGNHEFEIVTVSSGMGVGSPKAETATCSPGKIVTGGGAEIVGPGLKQVAIDRNHPNASGEAWVGGAHKHVDPTDDWAIQVYAICAIPVP
jgi:hypothetical protein